MARKKDNNSNERSRSKRRGRGDEASSDSDSAEAAPGGGSSTGSVLSNPSTPPEEGPSSAAAAEHKENGVHHATEEDQSEIDDFEQKLELVLDQLQSSKSGRQRVAHFDSLAKALTTRFCFEYFENRKVTIQDIVEHALKRADDETGSAAHILSLVLITMGSDSTFGDDIFREMFDQLNRVLMDHGAKPAIRAKCAIALSLGCFITDYGMEKTQPLLAEMLSIAFTSVRGHSDQNYLNAVFGLKATCLDMFSFLVSIESNSFTMDCLNENVTKLTTCLESPSLALRVAAGECIALLVEKCRLVDADYQLDDIDSICDKLQSLATDSQKSKSKKELREQRSNFRQILRTVEGDDEFGEETIKIGQERVVIECWQSKRYYDTFCSVLGSGMNLHLAQNVLLRDIFGLGPVVLATQGTAASQRISKLEKQFINNSNRKAREIHRNKLRRRRAEADL